ncbi:unnamed protein product [Pylaiella littoralis]
MTGVALASRMLVTTAALPLLFFSASQCSTAFVLRTASLCSSRTQRSVQERRWSSATATATATALARRTGGTRSPTIAPTAGAKQRVGVATILMMAADPAEEAAKNVAEAASAADEPSIPEGEEVVAAAPEEEEEDAGLMEEEDEDGEAQTEVVVEGEEEAKEQEEEEVDPMAEVRQQIEDLEKELILEENKLRDAEDSVDKRGQTGFLMMAAKVDNFRKASGAGTGDFEADAKSAVLRGILPAFEPFEAAAEVLKTETENEVKFDKSYQALYRQLKDVYTKCGATDFFGVVGEDFVYARHEKVSEEHNPIMKEGKIIKCVSPGVELKKNVIRKAACVVSLGPEKVEELAAEGEEDGEETPAAAAAAAPEGQEATQEEEAAAEEKPAAEEDAAA